MDKQAYIRGVLTKYAEQKQAGILGAVGRGIRRVASGLSDDAARAAESPGIVSRVADKVPRAGQAIEHAIRHPGALYDRVINDPGLRDFLTRQGIHASVGTQAMGSEFMRGLGLSVRPFSNSAASHLLARQSLNPEVLEYIARYAPQASGARSLRSLFSLPNIGFQAGRALPYATALGVGNQIGSSLTAGKNASANDKDPAVLGTALGGASGLVAGSRTGQILEAGVGAHVTGGKFLRGVSHAFGNPSEAETLNRVRVFIANLMKDKALYNKLLAAKLGGLALAGAGLYGGIRGGGALERKLRQHK